VETGDEARAGDGVGTGDGVRDVDVDIVNGDGKFGMGVSITITCKQVVFVSGVLDERSRKVRVLMKV
jgi:hypothetical protein